MEQKFRIKIPLGATTLYEKSLKDKPTFWKVCKASENLDEIDTGEDTSTN